MYMAKNKKQDEKSDTSLNKQSQGVDKDPAKEKKKSEKVTQNDLKNKTVDADPEKK
jgi:hypothetical protein